MAVGPDRLSGAGEEWKSLKGKSVLSWARKVKSGSGAGGDTWAPRFLVASEVN